MKIKGKVLTALYVTVLMFFAGCPNPGDDYNLDDLSKYSKEFLGEWIRMDTGERWYISGDSITVNGISFNGDVTLTKTSQQVVTVKQTGHADYFLFASRVANGSFSSKLVVIDDGQTGRSASRAAIPSGGVKIKPPLNPGLEQIVQPDPVTGEIVVQGIIPGDPVEITPLNPDWSDVSVGITPWNGQDMGIIPLAKGTNFKTTIRMANPDEVISMQFADGAPNDYIIEVENIGTVNATGASYELIELDNNNDINFSRDFALHSGSMEGLLDTIRPGGKKQIPLSLISSPIEEGRKVKKIGIRIFNYDTQTQTTKVWDDIVSVNYYKARIPFRFRSEHPVQGVVKAPGGGIFYFKTEGTAGNYTYSIDVPWSSEDYIIAFLGASVETGNETRYSLAIDDIAPSNWSSLTGANLFLNEPLNDSETTAFGLNLETNKTFMGYLHDGDVDYYRVNLGNIPPEFKIVDMEEWAIGDVSSNLSAGNTFNLDILLKNHSNNIRNISLVSLTADNTYAPYYELVRLPSYELSLPLNHYGTLTANTTSSISNGVQLLDDTNINRAIQFKLLPERPVGTMTLTLTFRDDSGINYIKTLNIEVDEQESFSISFNDFSDINKPVITAGTIYLISGTGRPTSANITMNNPQQYDTGSIKWYLNNKLITSGQTLYINSTVYNKIGQYFVTVEVAIGGKLYSKIITFEVRP